MSTAWSYMTDIYKIWILIQGVSGKPQVFLFQRPFGGLIWFLLYMKRGAKIENYFWCV